MVIAQFSVNENKVGQFVEFAKTLIVKTRQEKGCITYRLLNEFDKQNDFLFYEKYSTQEALELHKSSTHLKDFLNSISSLLIADPIIEVY